MNNEVVELPRNFAAKYVGASVIALRKAEDRGLARRYDSDANLIYYRLADLERFPWRRAIPGKDKRAQVVASYRATVEHKEEKRAVAVGPWGEGGEERENREHATHEREQTERRLTLEQLKEECIRENSARELSWLGAWVKPRDAEAYLGVGPLELRALGIRHVDVDLAPRRAEVHVDALGRPRIRDTSESIIPGTKFYERVAIMRAKDDLALVRQQTAVSSNREAALRVIGFDRLLESANTLLANIAKKRGYPL
jgi:hypothetical protein